MKEDMDEYIESMNVSDEGKNSKIRNENDGWCWEKHCSYILKCTYLWLSNRTPLNILH